MKVVIIMKLPLLIVLALISTRQTTARSFELKFQNEPDNTTSTIKSEQQQQIFKCQVRLAPVSPSPSIATSNETAIAEYGSNRWPRNVSLTMDWYHNNRKLMDNSDASSNSTDSYAYSVAIINVELKSNQSAKERTIALNTAADKRNKWRIEIKNTLNGNQLKLTSRLKLTQLRGTDSGNYKCIARATYLAEMKSQSVSEATTESNSSSGRPLVLVEQHLESRGANLVVVNVTATTKGLLMNSDLDEISPALSGQQRTNHHYKEAPNDVGGRNAMFGLDSGYLGNSFVETTRLRLVKLVHKIAPELSCYTGNGDHYRGNVSLSADGKVCLNWLQVRLTTEQQQPMHSSSSSDTDYIVLRENHNFCRNPNSDSRGPWCFVSQYSQAEDSISTTGLELISRAQNATDLKYIQRQCSIAPCSDYLWFYIVAPPLGLLMLISCLLTLLIKSIKNSHYKAMSNSSSGGSVSTERRSMHNRIGKLLSRRCVARFAAVRRFGANGKQSKYLDEDVFEIVDDIDWSDGSNNNNAHSPKSQESFKLNSSSFGSSSPNYNMSPSELVRMSSSKSTNPLFMSDKVQHQHKCNMNAIKEGSSNGKLSIEGSGGVNRSTTQVGPMFATLRCQMRNSHKSGSKLLNQRAIIDHCDLATNKQYTDLSSFTNKAIQSGSMSNFKNGSVEQHNQAPVVHSILSTAANSDRLISCSSTTDDLESLDGNDEVTASVVEPFVRAIQLPQLVANNLSVAFNQQPIYEGKFSQVLIGYMRQQQLDKQSKNDEKHSIGHIGTQVAICSLKTNTAIDQTVFQPSILKLRSLNHLNVVKLIGWFTEDFFYEIENEANLEQEISKKQQLCSLVYDLAQLVDLSDWLKQQNKDNLTSSEPGDDFEIRRNLTCFAKQIALGLDYLHDQNIIYKDLACRNCFLDPTKMLVKLASFNIEFVLEANEDQKVQNLKSMVRPKYLLDYYFIDSRPSECQLLPLSWIPLESILFNKFNKQTDVWSYGCLIYELFSLGEVAYFGYSSKQVIDAVRSNLMPPQPLHCPSGIYKLMCKCLSDIPTIRPSIKQIYEQLNLYSGQCSSFLDHHLCSLTTSSNNMMHDDLQQKSMASVAINNGSITKTKSHANIRYYSPSSSSAQETESPRSNPQMEVGKEVALDATDTPRLPLSQSINLGGNRFASLGCAQNHVQQQRQQHHSVLNHNHYDEPVFEARNI